MCVLWPVNSLILTIDRCVILIVCVTNLVVQRHTYTMVHDAYSDGSMWVVLHLLCYQIKGVVRKEFIPEGQHNNQFHYVDRLRRYTIIATELHRTNEYRLYSLK